MTRLILSLFLAMGFLAPSPARALLPEVRISNLSDITISNWNIADGPINASMDICIYAKDTIPSGTYLMLITTNTLGYYLRSGLNAIPFSLTWDDGGAGGLGGINALLTTGISLGFAHANTSSSTCANGPTARLNVTISQSDMMAAPAGTYTSTLTFLLAAL